MDAVTTAERGRRLLKQAFDLDEVLGMLMTQDQLGAGPDLTRIVAVHDRDGVRLLGMLLAALDQTILATVLSTVVAVWAVPVISRGW
ncbi:MAG: hypothetical protein QOE48_2872 [Mycobacterium sp.]|nr:hypothetical protein [Mycobacterium sp.]MDT5307194.1 hypothetical protein [Mycobacterium sp.]